MSQQHELVDVEMKGKRESLRLESSDHGNTLADPVTFSTTQDL